MIRTSLLFLLCLSAFSQDPVGSLEGEVRDPSGAGVTGAAVSLLNLDTGYKQAQVTVGGGYYKLSLAPVGRYQLTIEHVGFARFQQQPTQREPDSAGRIPHPDPLRRRSTEAPGTPPPAW